MKPKADWKDVRKKKGKLIGMLTDDLLKATFLFQEGLSSKGSSGRAEIDPIRLKGGTYKVRS